MHTVPDEATRGGAALVLQSIIDSAQRDERIVGLVECGSDGGDALDRWSDLDIAVFVRDGDFAAFIQDGERWLSQFGTPLLLWQPQDRIPVSTRVVYDRLPLPQRTDVVFYRETDVSAAFRWPSVPTATRVIVWYDGTGGDLTVAMATLGDQTLQPRDIAAAFADVSTEFWYFLLDASCKLGRGDDWAARLILHVVLFPHLMRLLRLESGALSHWHGRPINKRIVCDVSPERFRQLNACIPDSDHASLREALSRVTVLARDASAAVGARLECSWPYLLADRIEKLLASPPERPPST